MNLAQVARVVLGPLSLVYGAVVRTRLLLYEMGIFRTRSLETPVVSVGNLTLGGTGKTPMVVWLAERFAARGKRVGILSRGYKGAGGTSDEIELMRARLGESVAFGVGANRYHEGRNLEKRGGVDLFLLDDGFQHLKLRRDVNVLLIDAARPMASERLLPAGRLREPLSSMARADLLVFTRTGTNPGAMAAIETLKDGQVFAARTNVLGFRKHGGDGRLLSMEEMGAGPFFAFCGIGNPAAFVRDLENLGLPVFGKQAFADHHRYTPLDASLLLHSAEEAGAAAFVTTEKDEKNLKAADFGDVPVYFAVIEFEIPEEAALLAEIERRLAERSAGK